MGRVLIVLAAIGAMLVASAGQAVLANNVVTVPASLLPGQQYRLAFVTQETRDATSTNIADYNAFVTQQANLSTELAALGTTWAAIGSTQTVDARDNTGTNPSVSAGVPIYLLDGTTRIASGNAALWDGSLDAPLNIDQFAVNGYSASVWTGTSTDGLSDPTFPLGTATPSWGASIAVDGDWVSNGSSFNSDSSLRWYAMSGVLTVVPEPTSLAIFLSGACLIGVFVRRKRQPA